MQHSKQNEIKTKIISIYINVVTRAQQLLRWATVWPQ